MPRPIAAAALSLLLAALASPGLAASPCPISLIGGADIGAVDGARGAEWNDAAILQSLSPASSSCLGTLLDADGSFRPVNLRSKTYTDPGGARWLGLFVEVQDASETQPDGSTLANGEVLTLQIDPGFDGGTALSQGPGAAARDWKIEVRHFWATAGGGDPDAVASTLRLFDSSGSSGFCATPPAASVPHWAEVTGGLTPATTPLAAVRKDLPGGYTVEIAVPMALIGNPAGDIGIALAVVNDFGSCTAGSGICDGYGLSFPSDLPVTNADNPVVGCGPGWLEPGDWATGFIEAAPGDVTLSHAPRFWTSEDVDALACGVVDNNYYPANPCRMAVRANLRNASTSAQVRNLLILRGQHGAGVVDWTFVDLIEGVSVPASGQIASTSAEVSNLAGLAGHPCVRAYVLPPFIDPQFDLARMQAITSAADLTDLVATYGLRDIHSAQQNISRRPEAEVCPNAGCRISRALLRGADTVLAGLSLIGPAAAQEVPRRASLFTLAPAAHPDPGQPAGLLSGLIGDVGFDPEVLAGIAKEDAVVEIVALGYRDPDNIEPPLPDPRHNFIEVVGGAVERIPLARIAAGEVVDLALDVGNPSDTARHIGLSVRIHDPTGSGLALSVSDATVAAVTGAPFDPWQSRPITILAGTAEAIAAAGGGGPGATRWLLWLVLLVLLILLALAVLRRRSP